MSQIMMWVMYILYWIMFGMFSFQRYFFSTFNSFNSLFIYFQVVILCAVFAAVHSTALLAAPIVSTGVSSSSRTQDVSTIWLQFWQYFIVLKISSMAQDNHSHYISETKFSLTIFLLKALLSFFSLCYNLSSFK